MSSVPFQGVSWISGLCLRPGDVPWRPSCLVPCDVGATVASGCIQCHGHDGWDGMQEDPSRWWVWMSTLHTPTRTGATRPQSKGTHKGGSRCPPEDGEMDPLRTPAFGLSTKLTCARGMGSDEGVGLEDARRNACESTFHSFHRWREEEKREHMSCRIQWRWTWVRRRQEKRGWAWKLVQKGNVESTVARRHGQPKGKTGGDALASRQSRVDGTMSMWRGRR